VVLNSSSAANPGDTVTLTVENLADANGNYPAASQVTVTIAGIAQTVTSVTPASGQGAATIQFTVTSGLPTGVQQMTVMVGDARIGNLLDQYRLKGSFVRAAMRSMRFAPPGGETAR
jgi:hypothetical protein